jgi:hypothetical protein
MSISLFRGRGFEVLRETAQFFSVPVIQVLVLMSLLLAVENR